MIVDIAEIVCVLVFDSVAAFPFSFLFSLDLSSTSCIIAVLFLGGSGFICRFLFGLFAVFSSSCGFAQCRSTSA